MNDEKLNETEQTEEKAENTAIDYIEAIDKLKTNSVPKEEYDKLKEEHKQLLNAYVEGTEYAGEDLKAKENAPTLKEIESKLFAEDNRLSNLEYAKLSLEHRNRVLEQTGKDEYLPYGDKIMPTNEDAEAANRVAETLQHCIEYAQGDSQVFTNELQRFIAETPNKPDKRPRYR